MKEDRSALFPEIAASVVRHFQVYSELSPYIQEAFELEIAALLAHINHVQQGAWNRTVNYLGSSKKADDGVIRVINRIRLMKEGLRAAGVSARSVGGTVNPAVRLSIGMVQLGARSVDEYLSLRSRSKRVRGFVLPGRAFTTATSGRAPTTRYQSLRVLPHTRPGNLT